MYTIDFETDKIVNGSKLSPKPVGLSVKCGNEPAFFYACASLLPSIYSH